MEMTNTRTAHEVILATFRGVIIERGGAHTRKKDWINIIFRSECVPKLLARTETLAAAESFTGGGSA